jgi:hypothetical protein
VDHELLENELRRLGCKTRACGKHGYIFMPQHSGGINIEGHDLHFWDCDVNAKVDTDAALQSLNALPDGAGFQRTLKTLTDIAA